LNGFGIEIRTVSEARLPQGFKKPSEDQLRNWYVDEHKSTIEIAEEIGVSDATIRRWFEGYDVEIRTVSESNLPIGFKKPSEEKLRIWYMDERKTIEEIAEEQKVSRGTISNWLNGHDIEIRTNSESKLPIGFKKPSEEKLRTWYVDEHKSTIEIAEELGVSHPTIRKWLNDYGIGMRTVSEARLPQGFKKPSEEKCWKLKKELVSL
jgi:response regulator of citrate/malate metabolism